MDGYMLADKLMHQSRERVFVVDLVTGEISGTVSGLVRASVDGNVNLRVISGRIADGAQPENAPMKKNKLPARILAALLALVLVLSLCPIALAADRNRLHRLSASVAGLCQALRRGYLFKGLTVVLTDDIDADGAAVSIPIFLGDFDGQGHKITGLRLTESCSEYGLFSRMESGASVRNLTVEGEVIPAGTQTDVGGIVGQMVADITLRFSSGGLDKLEQAFALMADGPAAPDTAQLRADIGALQAADGVLEELLHLTLRFVARGKVLKRQTFGYGDSFTADDFPEAPKKDGCYADWNVTDLSDLHFDTTVTAVYRPYVTALVAGDTEDGRPALLAEGLFRTGDTLQAVQADTADAPRGAAGVWTLTLPADGEESHTIRWRVPADGAKRYTVYTAVDGGWKKAQTSTAGSYLCFALPSDSAQFAVVPAMHAAWQLWASIAAALTAIAAVITLVIRKRRAKAAKRAQ